jgi:23S rRNA (pseudouridine1915-N3)-methyltransferase
MKIKIISPANKMPDWVNTACKEFQKRLDDSCKLEVLDIPLYKRGKNTDIKNLMEKEGKAMLALTHEHDRVVALDISGKTYSSEAFASQVQLWQQNGQNICFYIGGPEGLAENCIQRANQLMSLSALTLPHPLVRVVLIEQIYRANCIIKGHPYHK